MGIITTVIVFIYLLLQSKSDIKTMQVYTFPNNCILIANIMLYIIDCIRYASYPVSEFFIIAFAVILLCKMKMFGSGDAKAMLSTYLALRYVSFTYPHPNLGLFIIEIISANFIFIGQYFTKIKADKKDKKAKKERMAYFPAITVGYVIAIIFGYLSK